MVPLLISRKIAARRLWRLAALATPEEVTYCG
jgi:hypothetical protein